MLDIEVIEDPAAAEASLDPIRTRILMELAEPGSATQLAAKVGLPRQKVNYHLKALERHGLVELVEERRKGNVTERILQATAASYLISPAALASVAPDPHRFSDRFSAFWLLALAGRMVQEMGQLIAGAAAGQAEARHLRHRRRDHLPHGRGPGRLRRGARRRRDPARGQVPRRRPGGPGRAPPRAADASTGSSSRFTPSLKTPVTASSPTNPPAKEQDND